MIFFNEQKAFLVALVAGIFLLSSLASADYTDNAPQKDPIAASPEDIGRGRCDCNPGDPCTLDPSQIPAPGFYGCYKGVCNKCTCNPVALTTSDNTAATIPIFVDATYCAVTPEVCIDGVLAGSEKQSLWRAQHEGLPCGEDTDKNVCSVPGCLTKSCVQTHPELSKAQNGIPCDIGDDGNVCTAPGCQDGTCLQNQPTLTAQLNGTACAPDSDISDCKRTIHSCDDGSCRSVTQNQAAGTSCDDLSESIDPAVRSCQVRQCNERGACVLNNLPDGASCGTTVEMECCSISSSCRGGRCSSNTTLKKQGQTCTPEGVVAERGPCDPAPTCQGCSCAQQHVACPVTGVCGSAAKPYTSTDTTFQGQLCQTGQPDSTPSFPQSGASATWTCLGTNGGGNSQTCTATRSAEEDCPPCPMFDISQGSESVLKDGTIGWPYSVKYDQAFKNFAACSTQASLSDDRKQLFQDALLAIQIIRAGTDNSADVYSSAPRSGNFGSVKYTFDITLEKDTASGKGLSPGSSSDYVASYSRDININGCPEQAKPAPIVGQCGAAAKIYPANASAFTDPPCAAGLPNPAQPSFPSAGAPSTWICQGLNGGNDSSTCTATKASSNAEVCAGGLGTPFKDRTVHDYYDCSVEYLDTINGVCPRASLHPWRFVGGDYGDSYDVTDGTSIKDDYNKCYVPTCRVIQREGQGQSGFLVGPAPAAGQTDTRQRVVCASYPEDVCARTPLNHMTTETRNLSVGTHQHNISEVGIYFIYPTLVQYYAVDSANGGARYLCDSKVSIELWDPSPISLLWNKKAWEEPPSISDFPVASEEPKRELTSWFEWRASANAPLLIYDPTHTGNPQSGADLFGSHTFGKTWNNGYEALRSLDANNDAVLTESELTPLALWFDTNRDGVAQQGEVKTVVNAGVTKIYTIPDPVITAEGDITLRLGFERVENNKVITGSSIDWFATRYPDKQTGLRDLMRTKNISPQELINSPELTERYEALLGQARSDGLPQLEQGDSIVGAWKWASPQRFRGYQSGGILVFGPVGRDQTFSGSSYVELRNPQDGQKKIFRLPLTGRKIGAHTYKFTVQIPGTDAAVSPKTETVVTIYNKALRGLSLSMSSNPRVARRDNTPEIRTYQVVGRAVDKK